jgi:alpha/beta superfamily hydrolase
MARERIFFESDALRLEGILDLRPGPKGAVVSHPHPLYGGNMHNPVVEVLCRAYARKGFSTLRFNFRGTARSEGSYEGGEGETTDVLSALRFLKEEKGKADLDLAGYSFGAWVNARVAAEGVSVTRLVMVAPPVAVLDFSDRFPCPALKLVLAGSDDEIAPPALIRLQLPRWNPTADFQIIEGADHVYTNTLKALEARLGSLL